MSIRLFLSAVLPLSLLALLTAAPAEAQTCQSRAPAATVSVKVDQSAPVIHEERTYSELTRLFKKPGTHPAGLYVGAFTVGQQSSYRVSGNGRELCVSMEAVEVKITLTDPKIYVGSELANDDCARESVWQHEVLHYRIDQDVLERFTPAIQRTVEFAVKQSGSQVAKRESDVERIGERMARTVRQHLDRAVGDMQSERDRLHDRHDSRDEYARTGNVCADGKLGNSKPVMCASEPRLCTNLEQP
ncbi:MAG TPA: hypothetical protein VEX87_10215 [Skermanella sp.]|nr:hypothetical protein [Skermanella sp.]